MKEHSKRNRDVNKSDLEEKAIKLGKKQRGEVSVCVCEGVSVCLIGVCVKGFVHKSTIIAVLCAHWGVGNIPYCICDGVCCICVIHCIVIVCVSDSCIFVCVCVRVCVVYYTVCQTT